MDRHRIVSGALTLLLAVACSRADAADVPAFTPRAKGLAVSVPASGKPGTGVLGSFDLAALSRPTLLLTLADGTVVHATQNHVTQTPRGLVWQGTVPNLPVPGTLTISVRDGVVSGVLEHAGATYELRPAGLGTTLLFEVDQARLPPEAPPRTSSSQRATSSPRASAAVEAATDPAVSAVHDLLVLTTASARARFGAGLDGAIQNAVARANAAYRTGGLDLTLDAVGIRPATFEDGPTMYDTIDRLETNADVRAARDELGADLVLVVSADTDYCGIAELLSTTAGNPAAAFGVVAHDCLSSTTLAHEVGHLQGLMHDRETSAGEAGATPYAYGYRICSADGFRDIMSYACPGVIVARLNEFSNPRRTYNGYALGVEYTGGNPDAADAIRALAVTGAAVSTYRTSLVPQVPATPTGLAATTAPALTAHIDLTWTDTSDSEAGFAVERSTDGATWTEIARVATDTTSFTDATVAEGVTYQYRVKAHNGAGSSGYSNVVSMTPAVADAVPDAFEFQPRTAVGLSQVLTSNAIVVSGIDLPVTISVANGEYSIGCNQGSFTRATGSIANGESVCVRHTSASVASTIVTTTLTIGGVSGAFVSDTTPRTAPPSNGSSGDGGSSGGGGAADPASLLNLLPLLLLGSLRRRSR